MQIDLIPLFIHIKLLSAIHMKMSGTWVETGTVTRHRNFFDLIPNRIQTKTKYDFSECETPKIPALTGSMDKFWRVDIVGCRLYADGFLCDSGAGASGHIKNPIFTGNGVSFPHWSDGHQNAVRSEGTWISDRRISIVICWGSRPAIQALAAVNVKSGPVHECKISQGSEANFNKPEPVVGYSPPLLWHKLTIFFFIKQSKRAILSQNAGKQKSLLKVGTVKSRKTCSF